MPARPHVTTKVAATHEPRRIVETLIGLALASVAGCLAALVPLTIPTTAVLTIVAGAVLLLRPWIGLLCVLAAAGYFGVVAAHVFVPGLNLPVLEVGLAASALAACAGIAVRSSQRRFVTVGPALLWLPAAVVGVSLVAFRNNSDAISGLREALIFTYPFLIAAVFTDLSPLALRAALARAAPFVVALGWAILLIGAYRSIQGVTVATSTGQLRALASSHAPPLVAAAAVTLWRFQTGAWGLGLAVVGLIPLTALLLVNHRSAFLGVILAFGMFAGMRWGLPRPRQGMGPLVLVTGALLAFVLVLTPIGRAGVDRFATLFEASGDPNVQARLDLTREATSQTGIDVIVGRGVGQQDTVLSSSPVEKGERRYTGVHDSYAAIYSLGGLVGLLSIAGPLLWLMAKMMALRRDPLVQSLVLVIVFTAVMAAFNVVLENSYFGIWLWVPVAVGGVLVLGQRTRNPAIPWAPARRQRLSRG